MIIELIGCTSSGKSTLLKKVLASHRGNNPEVISAEGFVLRQLHLAWLSRRILRQMAMTLIGLTCCLLAYRKYRLLLDFSVCYLNQLPPSVSIRERFKIARILSRNIGIYEFIEHHDRADCIIVLDEGMLHIAHYLFVYESVAPDLEQVKEFVELVPCPDVVVHLCTSKKALIERTMVRGHKRIIGGSLESVESFISHAVTIFECLGRCPAIKDRLLLVNPGRDIKIAAHEGHSPVIDKVMAIFAEELVEPEF